LAHRTSGGEIDSLARPYVVGKEVLEVRPYRVFVEKGKKREVGQGSKGLGIKSDLTKQAAIVWDVGGTMPTHYAELSDLMVYQVVFIPLF
jgi:hypothetical protein